MWSKGHKFQKVGWHATWHGHLHKEDTPLNKWLNVPLAKKRASAAAKLHL
jgi:hypothetical protein